MESIYCVQIEKLNVIKLSVLYQITFKFNAIPTEIAVRFIVYI